MKVVKGWVIILLALALGWMLSWIVSARFGSHVSYIMIGSIIFIYIVVKLINRYNKRKQIQEMAKSLMKAPQEKLADYDRTLEIHPQDALTWLNKGHALEELGRNQEAIISLSKFVEFASPRHVWLVSQVEEDICQLKKKVQ